MSEVSDPPLLRRGATRTRTRTRRARARARRCAMSGLSNEKFRDLLSQPKEAKAQKPADTKEEREQKKAKQQAAYERRMAIQKRREEALQEASRYKDRAAERRKEAVGDAPEGTLDEFGYLVVPEESGPEEKPVSTAPTAAQLGDREELEEQSHRISIQQSKYLGGDIEHTHLVKGLDFALLQKIRCATRTNRGQKRASHSAGGGNARDPCAPPAPAAPTPAAISTSAPIAAQGTSVPPPAQFRAEQGR